ncbi:response regulator transcription factor [Abyssisolibacter fermentans]|uniref:response regulator transcription factor n=1 Tax=Abyssisolibacter fermentans TaxID=1766203 RepID=UPI000832445F|nr:response regulator transcription factor [Abyssisolibacter fermentans]
MTNYNILVVDDDEDILEIICIYLRNAGYTVYTASSSTEALEKIKNNTFHLIILDIILPDYEGTKLCENIRQNIYCPIIFISCIDDEEYILKALDIGGDDYIRKPFNSNELLARVKANLRRVNYDQCLNKLQDEKIHINNLTIDINNHIVLKNNKKIYFSPIEFNILLFMVNHPNKILSYSEIYEHVWENDSIGDTRTVMVHVSKLRKKLEEDTQDKYIETVKKMGYKFITN